MPRQNGSTVDIIKRHLLEELETLEPDADRQLSLAVVVVVGLFTDLAAGLAHSDDFVAMVNGPLRNAGVELRRR